MHLHSKISNSHSICLPFIIQICLNIKQVSHITFTFHITVPHTVAPHKRNDRIHIPLLHSSRMLSLLTLLRPIRHFHVHQLHLSYVRDEIYKIRQKISQTQGYTHIYINFSAQKKNHIHIKIHIKTLIFM